MESIMMLLGCFSTLWPYPSLWVRSINVAGSSLYLSILPADERFGSCGVASVILSSMSSVNGKLTHSALPSGGWW